MKMRVTPESSWSAETGTGTQSWISNGKQSFQGKRRTPLAKKTHSGGLSRNLFRSRQTMKFKTGTSTLKDCHSCSSLGAALICNKNKKHKLRKQPQTHFWIVTLPQEPEEEFLWGIPGSLIKMRDQCMLFPLTTSQRGKPGGGRQGLHLLYAYTSVCLCLPCLLLLVVVLRQGLSIYSCLSWNSLCNQGWHQTHRYSSASAPWLLELKVYTTTTGSALVLNTKI